MSQFDSHGGAKCEYCGVACSKKKGRDNTATVDHRIPKVRCGKDEPENWAVCCLKCNRNKGHRTADEYLRELNRISQAKKEQSMTTSAYITDLETRNAELTRERDEAREQLAAANATVEKCKQAGFIDDKGEVRKVLGTLPLTADNRIVGSNCIIWHPKHGACVCRSDVDSGCWAMTSDPCSPASGELFLVEECYSAAEAAREGKGNK